VEQPLPQFDGLARAKSSITQDPGRKSHPITSNTTDPIQDRSHQTAQIAPAPSAKSPSATPHREPRPKSLPAPSAQRQTPSASPPPRTANREPRPETQIRPSAQRQTPSASPTENREPRTGNREPSTNSPSASPNRQNPPNPNNNPNCPSASDKLYRCPTVCLKKRARTCSSTP
jgi:hypothetical protein